MTDDVDRKAAAPTFEAALARLEEIVGTLERGEAPLEEGLALFEEGIALTRRCQELLADADERIKRLVAEGGRFTLEPFAVEDAEDAK
ncbi:MAG: exodeoxyribonuclease VII small subunit [bacterium]